ncbi:Uncharacterised protein [Pragia fontium]|uniref:hypothetical protein n=1 Tax=Pragia fontium TaxID=82985 RepID=UPI000E02910F|nr:hypothetical protein [Pragia fontium]SUB84271.1 Uncharacterised protein [Pragia fontium]
MEYSSEYLLIFSEEIKISQNEKHLRKIIESNNNLSVHKDESITFKDKKYQLHIKK